mmetsp:Transcript_4774/g.11579  ORF Transcript_4774/g.11579 Transcript_4774/m.11579 type:complete len:85 (-) Transcript_4774:126-380(-)
MCAPPSALPLLVLAAAERSDDAVDVPRGVATTSSNGGGSASVAAGGGLSLARVLPLALALLLLPPPPPRAVGFFHSVSPVIKFS